MHRARLFRVGDYSEKHIDISQSALERAAAEFKGPIDLSYEFTSVPDGRLGRLVSVEVEGDELYGQIDLPDWLANLIGKGMALGAQWDRDTRLLVGVSFTRTPTIPDTKLL